MIAPPFTYLVFAKYAVAVPWGSPSKSPRVVSCGSWHVGAYVDRICECTADIYEVGNHIIQLAMRICLRAGSRNNSFDAMFIPSAY